MKWLITVISFSILLYGCDNRPPAKVQILGQKLVEKKTVNGRVEYDTVSATIPAFSFIDQDSTVIDTNTVNGKIYVVDFFFTHCPSICPKMKAEMHRVYDKYKDQQQQNQMQHLAYAIQQVPEEAKNTADQSHGSFLHKAANRAPHCSIMPECATHGKSNRK